MSLPKEWLEPKLGDVVSYKKGKKPKVLQETEEGNYVPYIDIKAFEKGIIRQYADIESSVLVNKNDFLIVWDGARSGLVGGNISGALGSTLMKVNASGLDNDYIFRFLQFKFDDINSNTKGTGIPHVDPAYLWNIDLPIPPLNEQKRIAQKLDELLATVENIKTRLDNAPTILKRFRQSILAAATSGKLTEEWRRENEVNIEWKNISLKDATSKVGSGSTPRGGKSAYKERGIPLIRSMNIHFNGIKYKDLAFIDDEQAKKLSNVIIEKNDVLLNITGASIGRVTLATEDLVGGRVNQHVSIIRTINKKLLPEYLNLYLASPITQKWIQSENYGGTREALTKGMILNYKILQPILNEQKEIVTQVESLFALADSMEAKIEAAQKYVDKLTQSILAKAFRGELVPQDPTDESAEKLLERIKAEQEVQNSSKKKR